QVFRRETNLERLLLNGRLTVSLLIPDVRVDDLVEMGVTLRGSNPVLGGRYAAWAAFDSVNPWLESRCRIVRPLSRDIVVKTFNDLPEGESREKKNGEGGRGVLAGKRGGEPGAFPPPWLMLAPAIQFSEFAGWSDVAHLFAPFYESVEAPDV